MVLMQRETSICHGEMCTFCPKQFYVVQLWQGARGRVAVMALRYKPAGRVFDSPWCHSNFSVT